MSDMPLSRNGAPDPAPADAEALQRRLEDGLAHHQNGRLDRAAALYEQVLAADPDNVDGLFLLGGVHLMRGDDANAVQSFERALAAEPQFVPAFRMLGEAHKNLGHWDDAIRYYGKALEFEPDAFGLWNQLGYVLRQNHDLEGALEAFTRKAQLKYKPGETALSDAVDFRFTSKTKLKHDIEQFCYLMAKGILDKSHEKTVAAYTGLLENFPENPHDPHASPIPEPLRATFAPVYNRHVHVRETPALDEPALNPLDRTAVEADYEKNRPGITYVDDFLTPEALESIRAHCLESMVWHEFRYPNGYLGAFMNEGFFCPLVLQIVEELPRALAGIFENHKLINLWGYKYDSRMTGINRHADEAAVNVNFWITPDAANEAPETGGLVIWDKEAPVDWDFKKFNADQDAMEAFIRDSGAAAVRVPHKQNRAVIFNSDLFHATDEIHFKDGYENRRVNVTLLYGHRNPG